MDDMIDIYNETINIYKKLLEKYLHETSSIVQDRIIKTLERLFRDDYAKGLKEEGILAKEIIEKLKKLDSEFSNMQTNTENLSKNFKNEMNSNSMLSNIEEMKRIRTAEQTGLNEQDSRFGIINGNDDSWCIKGLEILSDTTEYKRILELLDEIVNLLNGSTSGATGSTTSSKASPRI
jgi:spore coat protein CotH